MRRPGDTQSRFESARPQLSDVVWRRELWRASRPEDQVTLIESTLALLRWFASVTTTVKERLPFDVGLPLTWPLVLKVSPGGRVPEPMCHVYGAFPPVAASEAE